jgi:hypothetical protein
MPGMGNAQQMASMMSNPRMQQMMSQMMSDPAMIDQVYIYIYTNNNI